MWVVWEEISAVGVGGWSWGQEPSPEDASLAPGPLPRDPLRDHEAGVLIYLSPGPFACQLRVTPDTLPC